MITVIVTGLEERVEDFSDILNAEIKKKKTKNTIKIKMHWGVNRWDEAGEQINDLEHRVMESNEAEPRRTENYATWE